MRAAGPRRGENFLDGRRLCLQSRYVMKAQLVRIGNSRGIRLPKVVIEQARLTDEVELEVRGATVVITAARRARDGWAEAAQQLRAQGGDQLLDPPTATDFEDAEWQW